MKLFRYTMLGAITAALAMGTACTGDLDVTPDDPNKKTQLTSEKDWWGYFGTLYGNLLYEGNLTPNGVDGGAGTFSRCHWNLQELTADEVVLLNTWNDPGYSDVKFDTWTSNNVWAFMCMQREATTARQCVEFNRAADDAAKYLSQEEIDAMKAESTVIKDLCYYYMIDLFGRGPWVDESTGIGDVPPTYSRKELFDAVVAELTDVINSGNLRQAGEQQYGRLTIDGARMLLAKLYLNAEVYTGTAMYDKCAQVCKEIVKNHSLAPQYKYLFCATNDKYEGAGGEILWALPSDSTNYQTYGSTTYLTAAAYFGDIEEDMIAALGNPKSVWNGLKVKPELVNAFEGGDLRSLFYQGSYALDVSDLNNTDASSCGYMCIKYRLTNEDNYDNDPALPGFLANAPVFPNTDYPLFRLADTYLMLAECQARGVNGADNGYEYFNKVRDRAGVDRIANPTLNDIITERQRELYWEGHRRSDLVRFGLFTGGRYLWSWKGGELAGTSLTPERDLFAIPYQYVSTVGQNPGY